MSELLALGVSHKTAPVALRERLSLTERGTNEFLASALASPDIHEVATISTCNRTEVYAVVGDPVRAESTLLGMLADHAGIRPTELADVIYSPRNCDAARQLYRVTAGLESMIVGEAEVQGQVKRAYEAALQAGATGPLTNRLFRAALQTGKRVRSETAIGASRLSLSSVAVKLAKDALGDLGGRHVVIIGTGETAELTAEALARQGVSAVFVANRRVDRARSMAERFGGRVTGLDDLPRQLEDADIVVASTASPHPIVGRDELEVVMNARAGRSLLLIDIAVPRDVDPACAELPGVTLYDIDDLQAVVARHMSVQEAEARRAHEIVEEEIDEFAGWLGQLDVLPTITALREHGARIVSQVLAENAGRWEDASPRDLARVEAIARAVMNRLLHEPTVRLRGLSDGASHGRLQVLRALFGLDEGTTADAADVPAAGEDDAQPDNVRPLPRRDAG
jgi:glutamyl-tRNA reductase